MSRLQAIRENIICFSLALFDVITDNEFGPSPLQCFAYLFIPVLGMIGMIVALIHMLVK